MKRSPTYVLAASVLVALAACSSSKTKHESMSDAKTTTKSSMTTNAPAKATLGMTAPDFTLKDMNGKTVRLSDYRGKTVVLEWFNPTCPYVKYAYGDGPLKSMAKDWSKKGVVWLTINSGAPGKPGAGTDTNMQAYKDWGMSSQVLLDESGEVGKKYEAKTTPHMYVIDPQGMLVYRGALDNAPLGTVEGSTHTNYVENTLKDLSAGRHPTPMEEKPYGCGVKYAN